MDDLSRECHDKSREVHNALCMFVGTRITRRISVQNGVEVWRQVDMRYKPYSNGISIAKLTEVLRLGFRTENEFQDKLTGVGIDHRGMGKRIPKKEFPTLSSQTPLRKVHQCQNTFASTQTTLTPTRRSSSVHMTAS